MSTEHIDVEKKRQELLKDGQLTEREVEMKLAELLIGEIDKLQADYAAETTNS